MKKAYISIEGKYVKAALTKKSIENAQFVEFEREYLFDFIRENKIKEVYISVWFPELYTFKFSLPFKVSKKQKILDKLISNEMRKRYPSIQNFSFIYDTYITDSATSIRCYMVPESSYQFIEEFIEKDINIKALYPIHFPLLCLVNSISELTDKNKIVCFFSENSRFLFIFEKSEMILMRDFEGTEELVDEDIININMTTNYSIQNLRVTPHEIVLIGIKQREVSKLNLPYRVLSILSDNEKYTIPISMILFEEDLKDKILLPVQYKRFRKTVKCLKYASFVFIMGIIALFGYNLELFYKLKPLYSLVIFQREYISQNERVFYENMDKIKKFEAEIKPFIELQNKRNSLIDIRYPLKGIAQAKTERTQIESIEILNKEKPEIKIKCKSIGKSFAERQKSYLDFKTSITQLGFKITNESWDISKGELSLDTIYEYKKVSQ
ncbi:MAG: hypothetical protein NZ845_05950 [Thermodesulfovibrio sp.]|nr:hypothetical protein [Thermodesulfovibrio sp.]MDW7972864.1 hypothetical protein [Thermodesulfovibrio sp.]